MLMNRTSGWLKQDWEPVAKSVRRVPIEITRSARLDDRCGRSCPFQAVSSESHRRAIPQRTLAGEGLGDRNSQPLGEILQLLPGRRVMHTAPRQDHRPLGLLEQRDRLGDPLADPADDAPLARCASGRSSPDNRTREPGCPAARRS